MSNKDNPSKEKSPPAPKPDAVIKGIRIGEAEQVTGSYIPTSQAPPPPPPKKGK